MDDFNVWIEVCNTRTKLFQCIMPTVFNNLTIAQHLDTLQYATIKEGGY
jgi:hypothetical protein